MFGGNKYVVHSILLTNPSVIITSNTDVTGYLFSQENFSGIYTAIISVFNNNTFPPPPTLTQPDSFINETTGNIFLYPSNNGLTPNNLLIGDSLYFNIDYPQDATCDMYIYGSVIY